MKSSRNLICLVLTLIPFLCLIYFVAKYMVDVPFMDQWGGLVPLLEKSYQGSLSLNDLWAPHNEHRIFFPLIIMVTLARFSHWNISYEIATNILLGVGIFLTIIYQLRKTDKSINNRRAYWLIPIVSLTTFSLTQTENWLWGWQIQIFLNVLAVVIGIVLLVNYATKWLYFILALLMGIVGAYSFANGLIYWFVGLLILFSINHQDKRSQTVKIIVWTLVLLIIVRTYLPLFLHTYQQPGRHSLYLYGLRYPIEFVEYVLAYLGSFICSYRTDFAIFFGLFGLTISSYLILVIMKSRYLKFHVLLPYIALSLYALGSAVMTGIGRAGMESGCEQALYSRYTTISSLFWISNIVLLYVFANIRDIKLKNKIMSITSVESQADKLYQLCSDGISTRTKISCVVAILVVLIILNSVFTTTYFKEHYNWLMSVRDTLRCPALRSEKDDILLGPLHPKPDTIKSGMRVLKKYKLAIFRDSKR